MVQREVIILRFQEDMSLDEIAQVTEAPLSTVKSRLYRGLEALRPELESQPSAVSPQPPAKASAISTANNDRRLTTAGGPA